MAGGGARHGATVTLTEREPPRPAPDRRTAARWAGRLPALPRGPTDRIWAVAAGLLGLAVTAMLLNSPSSYVGDNRFEIYWAPARRLARQLVLWDAGRGLGRVREDLWPGLTVPVAALRALGLSPAHAEHAFHALLLAAAGTGMVALLRAFVRPVGTAHVVAGVAYAFGPYSATFLVPSSLFSNYAIAPWLALAAVQGTRGRRPLAWAAVVALLVLAHGDADLPGTAYAALWAALASAYVVVVERRARWRDLVSWWATAAALTAVVAAPVAVKVLHARDVFAGRLFPAETPESVSLASSWAESWRGLGFWVSYLPTDLGSQRRLGGPYYESGWGVLVTFAVPLAALAALWLTRWRARALFGAMAAISVAVMVGAHPPSDPSPYGSLLLRAYDAVPALTALRTTYKAGSGLMMGTAALAGLGVAALVARAERRPAVGAVTAVVLAAASFPFWTGDLYSATARSGDVPGYWRDAAAFLDRQPGDGRVLALPGTTKTAYRWGWVGDDVLDSLFRRPTVSATTVPLSGATASDVVAAVDRTVSSPAYEPGMLAPIARRLGIDWVLLRNDIDWRRSRSPRPARLQGVRDDPDLTLAAAFGAPGPAVAGPDDGSDDYDLEARLPAVEIYAVRDAAGQLTARSPGPPLVVDGDGEAWPRLAERGWLDGGRGLVYAAELGDGALAAALAGGAPIVVTDTNRRRVTVNRGEALTDSWTLAAGDGLAGREVSELFTVDGAESVAVATDARRYRSSGVGSAASGFENWLRPANAFDGDTRTVWAAGGLSTGVGSWVAVDLSAPRTVSRLVITAYRPPGAARRASAATVRFSDGTEVEVDLTGSGPHTVAVGPLRTTTIRVTVSTVSGDGTAPVGFADIAVPGLDLAEAVRLPTHVAERAGGELAGADVTYLFERVVGNGPQPEERAVRRWFTTVGQRTFALDGRLAIDTATPDELVDTLVGGAVGAWGDDRYGGPLEHRGGNAVDGDLGTAWAAPASGTPVLHARFPEQVVDHVDVNALAGPGASTVDRVTVAVGGRTVGADLEEVGDCSGAGAAGADPCRTAAVVAVDPPVRAGELTVELDGITPRRSVGGALEPVRVAEVGVGAPPAAPAPAPRCTTGLVTLDDEDVAVRLVGSAESSLGGRPLDVEACAPVRLGPGRHRLSVTGELAASWLSLSTGPPAAPAPAPNVEVLSRTPTSLRLRVEGNAGGWAGTGQSHDGGWSASVDGTDLGPPVPVDTQSAWRVPAGEVTIDLRYRPQRLYEASLAVSACGVLACAWFLRPRRRAAGRD